MIRNGNVEGAERRKTRRNKERDMREGGKELCLLLRVRSYMCYMLSSLETHSLILRNCPLLSFLPLVKTECSKRRPCAFPGDLLKASCTSYLFSSSPTFPSFSFPSSPSSSFLPHLLFLLSLLLVFTLLPLPLLLSLSFFSFVLPPSFSLYFL